jgi:uncharacterized protein (TIGR03435 family)
MLRIESRSGRLTRLLALSAIGILFAWRTSAQPARSSFQVVSIKPDENASGISITPRRSGNRITYVTEIRMLVYYAYRIAPFQLSGDLPNGVYDIEALVDGSPDDDELRLMFRQLLEDRFGLKLRTESKLTPAYELVVAKGGPRLKAAQKGGEELLDGRLAPEGADAYFSKAGPRLVGRNSSMAQLAESLARSFQMPVADRTGLAGAFDFSVAYSKEEPAPLAGGLSEIPPLQIAIEQLGLKLQSAKAPVRILVIERVTPPTAN